MSGEHIAYITLGVIVFIALLIVLVWCFCRKKRNRTNYKTPQSGYRARVAPSAPVASGFPPAQRQFRDPGYTLKPLAPAFNPPAQRHTSDPGYSLKPPPPGFVIPPAEHQFSDPGASVKAPPPGFVIPTANPQSFDYSSYP